jgi:hypothetical protein
MGKFPQIVDLNFRQAQFLSAAGDAVLQRPAEEVRKNCYDIGLHRGFQTSKVKIFNTEGTGLHRR